MLECGAIAGLLQRRTRDAVIRGNVGHGFGPDPLVKLFARNRLHPLNLDLPRTCAQPNARNPSIQDPGGRIDFVGFDGTLLEGQIRPSQFTTPAKWPIDVDNPQNFFRRACSEKPCKFKRLTF